MDLLINCESSAINTLFDIRFVEKVLSIWGKAEITRLTDWLRYHLENFTTLQLDNITRT